MPCAGSAKGSTISWPAMRTIPAHGRFVCKPLIKWSTISLAKRRRVRCSKTIRWRPLRAANCPTFPKSKMNCFRGAASGSFFSKNPRNFTPTKIAPSVRAMQGQTGPCVQQAQDFAHHIESIAGGAPPVPGIERIACRGTHNGQTLSGSEPAPKQANATRMGLGRNNNNGAVLPGPESSRDGSDFVDGIHDRRFEDVNGFRRHSFLNENELVVIVLAGERNTHAFQSFAGFGGMGKPDFRRVSCAVKFRGLDGAQRDRAAEHDDRPGFNERVFHHQPTAETEKDYDGDDEAGANDRGEESPSAKPRTRDPSGMDRSCHLGTGACYPAPPKRSTGGARVTVYDGRCSLSVPGPTSAPSERATASLMAACSPMAE